jgi:hypothetical protein
MGNSEADASGEVSNGDQLKAKLAELQAKSSDRSTPDKAIESFVAARNEMARYKCYIIEEQRRSGRSQDAAEKLDAYYLTFFAERAYAAKKPDADESLSQCVEKADKISLEIKEVKEETPTRAIALVNIRNITPIPKERVWTTSLRSTALKGKIISTSSLATRPAGKSLRYTL